VEKRNELDSLVHSVGKSLAEHNDKLDDATKTEVQAALDEAKKVEDGIDLEALTAKVQALSTASMKIGQAIYGKKDAGSSEGGDDSSKPKEGKEAEYEEKK
jgi:molecular chaperone DnaK